MASNDIHSLKKTYSSNDTKHTPKEEALEILKDQHPVREHGTWVDYMSLGLVVLISVLSYPYEELDNPMWKLVWYYGWLTAISTG